MSWQVRFNTITAAPNDIPGISPNWVQSQPPPPADAGNEAWVPIGWQPRSYTSGDRVSWNGKSWLVPFVTTSTAPADIPGVSALWEQLPYVPALSSTLRELRLTFLWPQLPNGGLGAGRQTFRTMVAGQITQTATNGLRLYFYQPQSFTNVVSAR
jgi:hypothetical protein